MPVVLTSPKMVRLVLFSVYTTVRFTDIISTATLPYQALNHVTIRYSIRLHRRSLERKGSAVQITNRLDG
jgi:hypothetical protein